MKSPLCALAILSIAFIPALAKADSAPVLPIEKAVELAKEALANKQVSGIYIQSIALQRTSLIGGKLAWIVKWSGTVPGVKSGEREWGLEIAMNGDVLHMVRDQASFTPPPSPR